MWLWHVPVLCDAAAVSRPVSALQTGSLLLLGAAFWWQVLAPSPGQRLRPLQGVAYLFAGCVACSVLGIIFTFAPVTVCKAYAGYPVERFGITPLRDQQIGGLIMWVPMCLVYLCAIFMQLARWYSPGPHFPPPPPPPPDCHGPKTELDARAARALAAAHVFPGWNGHGRGFPLFGIDHLMGHHCRGRRALHCRARRMDHGSAP